nr:FAD:protein FMN transferase [Prevotella sp.]
MEKKSKKRLVWQLPFLLLLIIGTVIIIKQQRVAPYIHNTGFVFGTVYHITYQYDDDLQPEIEAELKKVDNSLSMFNKRSTISKFNNGCSINMSNDNMFDEVYSLAYRVSGATNGAFDITVAPLVNAWGFGFKNGKMPGKHQVDSIMTFIGFNKIKESKVNGKDIITKSDKRMMLDCSAIAKGYGSDVVARFLRSKGIKNFMIELGGEIVTNGVSDKRIPWKIGVTKPSDDSLNVKQEIQTILNVTDMAMATSGNYRNFYYKGGKKYAHTIDPKTGYPVQHNILSSTVLAKNCATADAFATSFMVLGLDGSKKILEKHPELMAYFIYSDNKGNMQVWYSPNLKKRINA